MKDNTLFKRSDTPLPFCDRQIDALLHQIFVAPVLRTGRGPVANGCQVPCYTSDLSAAFQLLDIEGPGRGWGMERISGQISVWIAAHEGRPYVRMVFEDHHDMPAASVLMAAMIESANENSDRTALNGISQPKTLLQLQERAQEADYPFGERLTLEEALSAPEAALEAPEGV